MSWFNFQPQNDIDKARDAMVAFHNRMLKYPIYTLKYEELISAVAPKSPQIFLEGLGFAISSIEMSSGKVQEAMEALADKCQGKIPNNQNYFFSALSDREMNINFMDWVKATPTIAADTAKDVGKGAVEIGNAVIDTGKSLLTIGPLVVVAAVLFIVYAKTREVAGR
jgi:hypothetical protein